MTTYSMRAVPMSVLLITFLSAFVTHAQPHAAPERWAPAVQAVDEALSRKDVAAAERAWHEAYLDALASRRWEGMVAVGDAALRMGARPKARQSYLLALQRARGAGSAEGAQRVAQAFEELGDREVAEMCRRIARGRAKTRTDARAR